MLGTSRAASPCGATKILSFLPAYIVDRLQTPDVYSVSNTSHWFALHPIDNLIAYGSRDLVIVFYAAPILLAHDIHMGMAPTRTENSHNEVRSCDGLDIMSAMDAIVFRPGDRMTYVDRKARDHTRLTLRVDTKSNPNRLEVTCYLFEDMQSFASSPQWLKRITQRLPYMRNVPISKYLSFCRIAFTLKSRRTEPNSDVCEAAVTIIDSGHFLWHDVQNGDLFVPFATIEFSTDTSCIFFFYHEGRRVHVRPDGSGVVRNMFTNNVYFFFLGCEQVFQLVTMLQMSASYPHALLSSHVDILERYSRLREDVGLPMWSPDHPPSPSAKVCFLLTRRTMFLAAGMVDFMEKHDETNAEHRIVTWNELVDAVSAISTGDTTDGTIKRLLNARFPDWRVHRTSVASIMTSLFCDLDVKAPIFDKLKRELVARSRCVRDLWCNVGDKDVLFTFCSTRAKIVHLLDSYSDSRRDLNYLVAIWDLTYNQGASVCSFTTLLQSSIDVLRQTKTTKEPELLSALRKHVQRVKNGS
jgi:hypothetical protein